MTEQERTQIYYQQLEELLTEMNSLVNFDVNKINNALAKLCRLFGICKGVTQFFQNRQHEAAGKGETLVCYDEGIPCVPVLNRRIVTDAMTVASCTVYLPEGAPPLSGIDEERVALIMKTVLNFVSRSRLQKVVERLTFHDDADYPNLRYFLRYADRNGRAGALGGKAALHYNLRHYTLVNQEIGRRAGDIVMRGHFNGLTALVGDTGCVCRVGGDNFVLICGAEKLDAVIAYLNETPVVYDESLGKRIRISATAGVWLMPEGYVMQNDSEIMDKIISCSQAARNAGKESIVYYDDTMRSGKEHAMRIQQQFPEALKNEEFRVFYQPKIDVLTGQLAGAEALCRWFRGGQIVPPMSFIPILEQTMEICRLDFYMLSHVCADLRRWLDAGITPVRVSVNLSRKHMMDADLLSNILAIVDKYQVPHQYIEIELTETTTDVEFRDLKRVVSGLQQAGIATSVDDFGMGYSSLNLIREIPWNVLKVDKSFLPVEEDDPDSTRSIMFKYVVAMARELGLECIAEGVETPHQVSILRDNACDLAQGFFFDKPLPVGEFEKRLTGCAYPVV